MEDLFNWLATTPWGLAAVVFGLMILFALYAFLSERKTRRLYPDQDRRGTKAVAKKKAQIKTAKTSEGTSAKKTSGIPASAKKASGKSASKTTVDDDEALSLEGFFETLWGDEETGKKGLIESFWEDDEEDAPPAKSATAEKSKGKPQAKQTAKKAKPAEPTAKEREE